MTNKAEQEHGLKWWLRYVIVPVIGGGGIVAIIVAFIAKYPFPLETSTPMSPVRITNVNWNTYQADGKGSSIESMKPVAGTDCAIEISFDLKEDGWVAIYRKLSPQSLSRTRGIEFFYRGTGVTNTIELKLIDKHETVFESVWYNATATNDQRASWEALYSEFKCRKGSGRCQSDEDVRTLTLNLKEVDRIDFAFSNKPDHGDVPGRGTVVIEEILTTP